MSRPYHSTHKNIIIARFFFIDSCITMSANNNIIKFRPKNICIQWLVNFILLGYLPVVEWDLPYDSSALSVGSDCQLSPRDEQRLSQHSERLVLMHNNNNNYVCTLGTVDQQETIYNLTEYHAHNNNNYCQIMIIGWMSFLCFVRVVWPAWSAPPSSL